MNEGLPREQWNDLVDIYRTTAKIPSGGEFWEELSMEQKWFINELKKSFARKPIKI